MRRALIGWLYLSPLIGTAGPLYVLGLAHTIARPRENLPRSMYDLVFPLHICGGRVLADATGISTGASCCLVALFWLALLLLVSWKRVREMPVLLHVGAVCLLWYICLRTISFPTI